MLGRLLDYKINKNEVEIVFENNKAFVSIIEDKIVNFFVAYHRESRNSKAVEEINVKDVDFEVKKEKELLIIKTKELIIKVYNDFIVDIYDENNEVLCKDYRGNRDPFIRRSRQSDLVNGEGHELQGHTPLNVMVLKEMEDNMYFYGLGERTGSLNKKGYHYVNWNTDNPAPHAETFDRLYKSIPFLIGIKDKKAFGIFFDNHFESHFDMGKENSNYYYFGAIDGNLDYYFIKGPEISEVVKGYTEITGRTPLPQLWTLGYQQCRWSYDTKERIFEIAKSFREKDIPCDTIYLDIDYMDGFRVFTWDKDRFNNPKEFIDELKNMGFKVVTIIDPGVKVDKEYSIYKEGIDKGYFAKDKDGIVYKNWVWPGDSVYPDFTNEKVRNWWSDNQKVMMDAGVAGIWNDMNEPASFNGPLPDDVAFNNDGLEVTHKEIHNVYGHFMGKATYEGIKKYTNKRPFIVTRACYSGTQKYATVWTGDNQSTWEHLRMAVPMLMNLGLSGMAYCGTDVGGFGYDCTGELLSRWVQVGTFTPLFRNHSALNTRDQEPWAFDKETEDINRTYIKLRYKLIPYLYDLYKKCEEDGTPIIKPLLYNYQEDIKTYEINDEFMFGDNILVAPVMEQGVRERLVYLPKGSNWIDYFTGETYVGGRTIIKDAPLDICPIYIKSSSIVPTQETENYIGENKKNIVFNIYLDENTMTIKYENYLDDGESFDYLKGIYNKYTLSLEVKDNINIDFKISENKYIKGYESIKVNLNTNLNKDVYINGKKIEELKNIELL